MAQFDFLPEDFKDSNQLLSKTLEQTQKDLPKGVFASTTQSKEEGGGFGNTVLGVGDLLQKIPYTRNIGNSAEDLYSTLLSAAGGVGDLFGGLDNFFTGLIPDDVKRVLDIVNESKGKSNFEFTDADKTAAVALTGHPNFKVVDGVKADEIKKQIENGVVSPNLIHVLKLICDQGTDIYIRKLHGGVNHKLLNDYHEISGSNDRRYTKAVDLSFDKNPDKTYTEAETAKIFQLIDTIIDYRRPREVAAAFKFMKKDRETDKHNTLWVKSDTYKKYVHIAVDEWGVPAPIDTTTEGSPGTATNSTGQAPAGGAPGATTPGLAKAGPVFLIGDSIGVGMQMAGIAGMFGAKGFSPATLNVKGARALMGGVNPSGMAVIDSSSSIIAASTAVVIELGTNIAQDANNFEQKAIEAVDKIKTANPNTTVFWLKIFAKGTYSNVYVGRNQAIDRLASKGVQVIDTTGLGLALDGVQIHPANMTEYKKLSQHVVDKIGGSIVAPLVPASSVVSTGPGGFTGAGYDPVRGPCSGKAQPGCVALMSFLNGKFPGTGNMGIYACRNIVGGSGLSMHAEGRACDVAARGAIGDTVWAWCLAHTYIGLQEVIWNRQYWSVSSGVKRYGGSNPHTDHLHIGLTWKAARDQPLTTDKLAGL